MGRVDEGGRDKCRRKEEEGKVQGLQGWEVMAGEKGYGNWPTCTIGGVSCIVLC